MKAIKENRQYTITEADVSAYQKDGYDVYDDKGKLVAYGAGKTVDYNKYAEALQKIKKLEAELKRAKKKEV